MGNNWTSLVQQKGSSAYIYGADTNPAYLSNANYKVIENFDVNGLNTRVGVRDGNFVRDKELIEDGFSQAEGIGWSNIFLIN